MPIEPGSRTNNWCGFGFLGEPRRDKAHHEALPDALMPPMMSASVSSGLGWNVAESAAFSLVK
jgi:hypothetical protein